MNARDYTSRYIRFIRRIHLFVLFLAFSLPHPRFALLSFIIAGCFMSVPSRPLTYFQDLASFVFLLFMHRLHLYIVNVDGCPSFSFCSTALFFYNKTLVVFNLSDDFFSLNAG